MVRIAACLALVLSLGPASAFQARNGLPVEAVGPDAFDVSWNGASGARPFWCAAGDFVIVALGLPPGTEIYRYSPPVRGRSEAIRFGLDAARAKRTGLVRLQGGRGLTAGYARFLCNLDRD